MFLVVIGRRCRRRRFRWDLPPVTNGQENVACSPRISLIIVTRRRFSLSIRLRVAEPLKFRLFKCIVLSKLSGMSLLIRLTPSYQYEPFYTAFIGECVAEDKSVQVETFHKDPDVVGQTGVHPQSSQ